MVELRFPRAGDRGAEGLEGRYGDAGSDSRGVEFHVASLWAPPDVGFGRDGDGEGLGCGMRGEGGGGEVEGLEG